jgi:hypothetical protein
MPLLNYTTTVPAAKSVAEIEGILAVHGAQAILKEYDDTRQIVALSFRVSLDGQILSFRVPIQPDAVLKVLEREKRNNYRMRRTFTREQAVMIAWRIGKAWIEAQMALLDTEMVKLEQIFLPYLITPGGRTLYESISASKFLLLNEAKQ